MKDLLKHFRRRYFFSLGFMLVLVLADYVMERSLIEQQKEDARIINLAGRQRMLTYKMVSSAYLYIQEKDPEKLRQLRTSMRLTADTYWRNHNYLSGADGAIRSELIRQLYFNGNPSLQQMVTRLLEEVHTIILPGGRKSGLPAYPTLSYPVLLVQRLDDVVNQFEREAADKVDANSTLNTVLLVLGALSVVMIYLLVFSPMTGTLVRYFTSLKKKQRSLNHAKRKLVTYSRLKAEFIAEMSHELRTPLNGIFGMLEILKSTTNSKKRAEYTNKAMTSGRELLDLINEVLDISKIELGRLRIEQTPFDLMEMLDRCFSPISILAESKGVEFYLTLAKDLPAWVTGDERHCMQAVKNVAYNAIKLTVQGSVAIDVSISRQENTDFLHFRIISSGLQLKFGKPKKDQDSPRRKQRSANLAISTELVEMMGGKISQLSMASQGEAVSLDIPILPASKPLIEVKRNEQFCFAIVDDLQVSVRYLEGLLSDWGFRCRTYTSPDDFLTDFHSDPRQFTGVITDLHLRAYSGVELAEKIDLYLERYDVNHELAIVLISAAADLFDASDSIRGRFTDVLVKPVDKRRLLNALNACTASFGSAKKDKFSFDVLLVEDNPINLEIVQYILQEQGHRVTIAENGRIAVELIKSHSFDVIFMDIQMPELDGVEATHIIRNELELDTPIIALTGQNSVDERDYFLEQGMNFFVGKPFSPEDIKDALAEIHRQKSELERELA